MWHTLAEAAVVPKEPDAGVEAWPHIHDLPVWREYMSEPSRKFVACLSLRRVFEPFCTLCYKGSPVPHLLGRDHCRKVRSRIAKFRARARDELWLETFFVGGRVRFNMLDGELQALRYVPVPLCRARTPKDLPLAQHWFLGGPPVATATTPGGGRSKWPNLQTHKCWYNDVVHAAQQLGDALQASSIKNTCLLCHMSGFLPVMCSVMIISGG